MGHRPLVFMMLPPADHGDLAAKLADPLEGADQRVGLLDGSCSIAPGTEAIPRKPARRACPGRQHRGRGGKKQPREAGNRRETGYSIAFAQVSTRCKPPDRVGAVLTRARSLRSGEEVQGSVLAATSFPPDLVPKLRLGNVAENPPLEQGEQPMSERVFDRLEDLLDRHGVNTMSSDTRRSTQSQQAACSGARRWPAAPKRWSARATTGS